MKRTATMAREDAQTLTLFQSVYSLCKFVHLYLCIYFPYVTLKKRSFEGISLLLEKEA